MPALADRSLGQLLDQVAAKTPSPGGGSSSGMACALAAGLVQMTAAFALPRAEYAKRPAAVRERAGELRAQALDLAEHELSRLRRGARRAAPARGRAGARRAPRRRALGRGRQPARGRPRRRRGRRLAAEIARTGNRHLRGDAISGAVLAEAACTAAARLAEINLTGRPGDPRREEARRAAQAAPCRPA